MKKIIALTLAFVLVMSVFSGCSDSNPGEQLNTFTYVVEADIDDFNPYTSQLSSFVNFFTFNCYEPLFHLNENMEYEMDLAVSYEQVDELTYTFQLRENVTFHNGEPFTAADVVSTIQYVADPANGSYKQANFAFVSEVIANGDYEVTVKLSEPTPAFLDSLAWLPITSSSVDAATLTTTPIGTGAFSFVSWTPNDSIQLTKYEQYWDAEKVNFDKVIIKPYTDYSLAMNGMYAGDVDYISNLSVEQASNLDQNKGAQVLQASTSNKVMLFEIGLHNVEAFQDTNVMKAMNMVLDRDAINEAVFGGMGAIPTSVFPSGAQYHKDSVDTTYNVEQAKQLMAASAYPNGFEFEIMVLSGDSVAEMAAVIWKQELAKIGITMNINVCEMAIWLDAYLNRTYDAICNDYSMVGSDPATFCTVIIEPYADFQCKDMPELFDAIRTGATGTDKSVREAAYHTVQDIIAEACPVISYMEAPQLAAISSQVTGVTINAMSHVFLKGASK